MSAAAAGAAGFLYLHEELTPGVRARMREDRLGELERWYMRQSGCDLGRARELAARDLARAVPDTNTRGVPEAAVVPLPQRGESPRPRSTRVPA